MKNTLTVVAFFLGGGVCLAQPDSHPRYPFKYALIDGESRTTVRNKIQFTNNEDGYTRFVQEIVGAYKMMFRLSETQAFILKAGLVNYYTPGGIHIDDLHAYIADRMKAILPDTQYEEWKGLKSYPEYQFYLPRGKE